MGFYLIPRVLPWERSRRRLRQALVKLEKMPKLRSKNSTFERYFKLTMIEDDYMKFRCSVKNSTKWLLPLLKIPLFMKAARIIFYRLAGMVILALKIEIEY